MSQTPEQALAAVRAQLDAADLSPAARIDADAVLAFADQYASSLAQLDADLAAVDADPDLNEGRRRRHRDWALEGWEHRTNEIFPPLALRVDGMVENAPRQSDRPVLEQAARVPAFLQALYVAERVRRGVPRNPPRNPVDVTL